MYTSSNMSQDYSNNGCRIRGYYDRRTFGVNLVCSCSPQILVLTVLHGLVWEWGNVKRLVRMEGIVILSRYAISITIIEEESAINSFNYIVCCAIYA